MTHARPSNPVPHPANARPAFTLVELMISIALVALLILGVNQVFLYTGQAVGAGQAINDAVRDSRAVQTVFANDFLGIAPNGTGLSDSAFLAIHSSAQPAFLSAAAQAASRLGDPMKIDLNGDGIEGDVNVPGEVVSPATYTNGNHRLDTLGFYSRGSFQRQTGNDGTFVANMNSPEAFVSYGHLWLPDNNGTFDATTTPPATYPGVVPASPLTNPNNRYATQFVLGRVATLLRTPSAGYINDASTPAVSQVFVAATASPAPPSGGANPVAFYSPLFSTSIYAQSNAAASMSVTTSSGSSTSLKALNQSRIDLGGASIQSIQSSLSTFLNAGTATGYEWWYTLMGLPASASAPGGVAETTSYAPARFQCNPFVAKPLTAAGMAQASPYFLKGCSQFIVEYAGDFLTQNPDTTNNNGQTASTPGYGCVTAAAADGAVDYVLVPPLPGNPNGVPRAQWRKQILWYGLPRNTSGQAGIYGPSNPKGSNGDVVPLRDWREVANPTVTASPFYAPFEKTLPTVEQDYAASGASGMQAGETYTCVFGPNDNPAPSLIRITITLVDPSGRLRDGQTYQYVFSVPPQ